MKIILFAHIFIVVSFMGGLLWAASSVDHSPTITAEVENSAADGAVEATKTRLPVPTDFLSPEATRYQKDVSQNYFVKQVESLHQSHALTIDQLDQQSFGRWRQNLRAKALELLGIDKTLYADFDGSFEIQNIDRSGEVVKINLVFRSVTDVKLPAIVLAPKDINEPLPVVVVYHGHGDGKVSTAEDLNSYEAGLALRLAKEGFITLTYDQIGFGELQMMGHWLMLQKSLVTGNSLAGKMITDGLRAVKVAQKLPGVDPKRVGVAGLSMGGEISLYTAFLEDDIKASVVASFLGSYSSSLYHWPNCACQHIPDVLKHYDLQDVASAIAPRALLAQYGQKEDAYPNELRQLIGEKIGSAYTVFGQSEKFQMQVHPGGHVYSPPDVIEFFKENL